MIAHVSGEVVEKTQNSLIVDVGGIGYEVLVATNDFSGAILNQKIKLYTHDHLRENSHELFGFSHLGAKRLFEMLISVSGVGPKMALAVLNLGDSQTIGGAIAAGDSVFVGRASGVGKRLAERIIVDLKDKIGLPGLAANIGTMPHVSGDDALDALLALGYNLQQSNEILNKLDPTLDVQSKVKQALKLL